MSDMKVIMESWRGFVDSQATPAMQNKVYDSPIYFFNETLDGKNLIEEKVKPIKQVPLREFLEDMNNDVMPLEEAMDICVNSLIYEQQLLDEGLFDFIKQSWNAVKKGSQKVIAKAREMVAKIHAKVLELNIKVYLALTGGLQKVVKIFGSTITGATKAADGVMAAVLKLAGVKNPTQKQITKATMGFLVVAAASLLAYVALSETGMAADGLNQIAEVSRDGGADAIAGLCEGMDDKTRLLYESVCSEMANVSSEEIIKTCLNEVGARDALDGAKKALEEISGGEGSGYWDYFEQLQIEDVEVSSKWADSPDPQTGLTGERLRQQVDFAKTELLSESSEGVSRLAVNTTHEIDRLAGALMKANSAAEVKEILKETTQAQQKLLASALQSHARIVEASPEYADKLEAIGAQIKIMNKHAVESVQTSEQFIYAIKTDGAAEVNTGYSKYRSHVEIVGHEWFGRAGDVYK